MDAFEFQLRTIIKYSRDRLHPTAFVMYDLSNLTIAFFDESENIKIAADVQHKGDNTYTFTQLYSQVNELIRDRNRTKTA